MSYTACMYPIAGAVQATEKILGKDRSWTSVNNDQVKFLSDWFQSMRAEVGSDIPELESLASWQAAEVIEFIKKRGFSLEMGPLGPGEFAAASVLKLAMKWLVEGRQCHITSDGESYPGLWLDEGISYWSSPIHAHPIVEISTQSGDSVYLTKMGLSLSGFELASYAEKLKVSLQPNNDWGDLRAPMVDLDQSVDISWLSEMQTTREDGGVARVGQALQQTKFKMNPKGASVESAVVISILSESIVEPKPDFIIDEPFLVFVKRPSLSRLLFAGWIDREDWKDPGSVELE